VNNAIYFYSYLWVFSAFFQWRLDREKISQSEKEVRFDMLNEKIKSKLTSVRYPNNKSKKISKGM
jgi:hypothetical protein